MTINIALATSEALVLGCDSIASSVDYVIPAFGDHVQQVEGDSFVATFKISHAQHRVTNSVGGVTKMFPLHHGDAPVAAITAGTAKLVERSMSSCAHEFCQRQMRSGNRLPTVEAVATEFLAFMREKYDTHYRESPVPEAFRDGPEFLVGGYGQEDYFPSLFRVFVQANRVSPLFAPGSYGVAWQGQSDAVERLVRGYDTALRVAIQKAVGSGVRGLGDAMRAGVAAALQQLVDRIGRDVVGDMEIALPDVPEIEMPWQEFEARVDYGNLPLQDALDFVAFLVNLQSGRAKFSDGVPTVGGRTHVGVITRQDGFKMIDEAPLVHRNIGFL